MRYNNSKPKKLKKITSKLRLNPPGRPCCRWTPSPGEPLLHVDPTPGSWTLLHLAPCCYCYSRDEMQLHVCVYSLAASDWLSIVDSHRSVDVVDVLVVFTLVSNNSTSNYCQFYRTLLPLKQWRRVQHNSWLWHRERTGKQGSHASWKVMVFHQ